MRRGRLTTFHGNFSKVESIMNFKPDAEIGQRLNKTQLAIKSEAHYICKSISNGSTVIKS